MRLQSSSITQVAGAAWCAVCLATAAMAEPDDLPKRAAGEALDFEPGLQLIEIDPGTPVEGAPEQAPVNLEKAKETLENAKRKRERWQQLAKRGILSKAEAEITELQVARAAAKYSQARLAKEKSDLEALRKRAAAGQLSPEMVQAAEAALATTIALAAESNAALKRTQLMLAETNVHRQRQLNAAGIGSRVHLQKAEATLRQLQAAQQ
jgi:multidrug resistance efflux pump